MIHLAGKAHDLKKVANNEEYYEANTELTKRLFDTFLDSDLEVFVFMSSVKAVADKVEDILAESDNPMPVTHYGKSKLEAEKYILSKNLPANKRVYILRPCMIHGPNNKGNLNLLYTLVAKGVPYPFGIYKNERSFLSIDNLCFTIKALLEKSGIESGVYNVSDDESISTTELVEVIGDALGKKASILRVPRFFVQLIAKIGNIVPIPINSEKLQKLTENYIVSNEKIKKALQINKYPLSVREGLIKTIKSFS